MSHDVTGKVAAAPVRANRKARRARRAVPSALLVGALGAVAPLTFATTPAGAATPPAAIGYTLVTTQGGTFNFGAAPAVGGPLGETNAPVVGVAPTSTGKGYWVATASGGVFTFGDAAFYGSLGALTLNSPIVGIVPTKDGKGYYLVAGDGGVFTFGDAQFFGSAGALTLVVPDRRHVGDLDRQRVLPGRFGRRRVHLR